MAGTAGADPVPAQLLSQVLSCLKTQPPPAPCSPSYPAPNLPTSRRRQRLSPAKVTFTLPPSPFQAELSALRFPGKQPHFGGLHGGPSRVQGLDARTVPCPQTQRCAWGLRVSPTPGAGTHFPAPQCRRAFNLFLNKRQALPPAAPPVPWCHHLSVFSPGSLGVYIQFALEIPWGTGKELALR